ncbi:MAG: DUF58 domain-containing protein [Acidobacteriota bacterium]|nr:DUF58 domain-containing protein [Blastocatellia bacterium]MDW8412433.1 DUF58 domain-containing protein [Acidobacteriota bacterium]
MKAGFAGEYRSVFRGRGIEFDEVRPYEPGDDVRLIDWNVSARTGELYIKKHVEEREQTVLLVVDLSGSQEFASFARTKREVAAEICCVLGIAAASNNDRVGLLIFTDLVEHYVPPQRGIRHALRAVRDLILATPKSRKTNLSVALGYIRRVLRRTAVIFILSDFLCAGFEKELRVLARHHDVVAIRLQDPIEKLFPKAGIVAIEDAETGEAVFIDSSDKGFRSRLAEELEKQEGYLRRLFAGLSIDYLSLSTAESYESALRRLLLLRSQKMSH